MKCDCDFEENRKAVYEIYFAAWQRMNLHKQQMNDYNRHLDFALKQQAQAANQAAYYHLPWGENREIEMKALSDSGYQIGVWKK